MILCIWQGMIKFRSKYNHTYLEWQKRGRDEVHESLDWLPLDLQASGGYTVTEPHG